MASDTTTKTMNRFGAKRAHAQPHVRPQTVLKFKIRVLTKKEYFFWVRGQYQSRLPTANEEKNVLEHNSRAIAAM